MGFCFFKKIDPKTVVWNLLQLVKLAIKNKVCIDLLVLFVFTCGILIVKGGGVFWESYCPNLKSSLCVEM